MAQANKYTYDCIKFDSQSVIFIFKIFREKKSLKHRQITNVLFNVKVKVCLMVTKNHTSNRIQLLFYLTRLNVQYSYSGAVYHRWKSHIFSSKKNMTGGIYMLCI